MLRSATTLCLLICSSLVSCGFAQQADARLEALKKYVLEKDYPEVFGKDHYKTRIEDVLDVDVDNDGSKEFVVLYHPHYRQSAPIVIYKVGADLKVTRIPEGLAPGPVQAVSGEYLDAHTLGQAVDFEVSGGKATPESILNAMKRGGMNGLVVYDAFFHMDGRTGSPWFIDMRGTKLPTKAHDCASFEFSRVKQFAAGHLREDDSQNYLAVWVGGEIYVYLIHGMSNDMMLNKKLWVIKAPDGFNGFEAGQGLTYKTGATTAVLTLK